jgi:hypothetical protein
MKWPRAVFCLSPSETNQSESSQFQRYFNEYCIPQLMNEYLRILRQRSIRGVQCLPGRRMKIAAILPILQTYWYPIGTSRVSGYDELFTFCPYHPFFIISRSNRQNPLLITVSLTTYKSLAFPISYFPIFSTTKIIFLGWVKEVRTTKS